LTLYLGGNSKPEWEGVKERPDGLKIQIDNVGKESIDGADLARERIRVQQLARDGFNDPVRQQRFEQWSEEFEQAASKRNPPLSEEEIANTYYQFDKLMSKDNGLLPHDQRMELAEQFMYKAANPHTIGQGGYGTCNVAAEIEHRFTVLHPSDALRVVTDVATTGRFITDTGSIIDMSVMNNVMRPLPGAVKNEFNPTAYSGRDMFDQLFQTTAVEIHWQTQSVNGRPTSTVWDLRAGHPFKPGVQRYEFTNQVGRSESGEVVNNYSTNPPTRTLVKDIVRMDDPLSGKQQVATEWVPAKSPHLNSQQLLSVGKSILGHDEPPHMIARVNEAGAVQVQSVDELIEQLKEMQKNGGSPTTVFLDTRDPLLHGGTEDRDDGGAHVVSVQNIELTGNQYFGERAVSVEDLFRAMKYRPARLVEKPNGVQPGLSPTKESQQ
jgi:hypothetical protein